MASSKNIIIDTHIFLWALAEPNKLEQKFKQALQNLQNTIFVSSISITEIMIKASIGKLNIDFNPIEMAERMGFLLLDYSSQDAMYLKNMPFHHKDPFDRMLIAQSLSNKFHLMSNDSKFQLYQCDLV